MFRSIVVKVRIMLIEWCEMALSIYIYVLRQDWIKLEKYV